ncbi:type 1 fimbrial protein [Salmonella enterica subsp. diarizonae]|nr:type 1 fimbrial protein [Salmonella enterica subsp. diarizonae]
MKRIFIATGMLSFVFSGGVHAYDGTINFVGKVLDQTCSVTTGSKNLTVTLPTVSKALLDTSARTAALTPFVIELNGCDTGASSGGQSVKVYFEPNATTDFTTGNLTNTGTATNVQVQLVNADGNTPIVLGKDVASQNTAATRIDASDVKLRYSARYYATGAATAGDVAATVNYTIAYE